ncbi:MAG: YtxH domain-containing protein [Cytophagaceae bacterium]|nr:YtxH domain-containing protein [Cytophagaceae bacterium]
MGFLAGACAGAVAGVLLAPDKGKNTRTNLANKTSQLTDSVGSSLQKGFTSLKDSAFSLINKYEEEEKMNEPTGSNPQNFNKNFN